MKRFLLTNCITDCKLIEKFLKENPKFGDVNNSDYKLDVVDTHVIYKFEEEDRVVYTHYDQSEEKGNLLFRICIYKLNYKDPSNLDMPRNKVVK